MKKASNDPLKIAVMVFVLPVVLLSLVIDLPIGEALRPQNTPSTQAGQASGSTGPTHSVPETEPTVPHPTESMPASELTISTGPGPTLPPAEPEPLRISVQMDGQLIQMALEDYLLGVILAEMPASFHPEALKAQAVACRSYALVGCTGKGNHKGSYICTSSACCQAYLSPEKYIQSGGRWEHVQKVSDAIAQTEGEILTYQGQLVLATYFSCSGGRTESAITVFGVDYPYLKTVESPGEESAAVYAYSFTLMPEEFAKALHADLSGPPENWIGEITYTQGGGIHTIRIGQTTYDGQTVKSLLGLRSTVFTIRVTKDGICVETKGYGHRVGMSQYGAQAMAQAGSSYRDILSHYYTGTSIVQYDELF